MQRNLSGSGSWEVIGLPRVGEYLPARSLFLTVAELLSSTATPRRLIVRGPALAVVAFTVVERGEMTFRFILVRSALVWARVRAAGGLEDTTSFFSSIPPTTRLPEPEEDMNEWTPNKLREAQNCRRRH